MKTINKYGYIIYPFLIVFGIGVILMIFPKGFIPDYFNIKNYSKTHELFNLIISSLVSLIGIYITVSLIAYEFFRQKSGIDFTKSFLVSQLNGYFISFTVFTILFTFISSIIVSFETPTDNDISLVYFIAILFIVVILCLFPIAFNLFSSLKPEKVADSELSKIDSQSILLKNNESIYKQAENDPLIRIENIVISLLTVKDVYKALSIIQKVTRKIYKIIIEENNKNKRDYFIDRLISFYVKIIDSTITQPNNSAILKSVWANVEDIYNTTAITKKPIKKLNYFQSQFIRRYFNRLFQTKNEEIINEGIITLKRIIINQALNNIPHDDENPSLNTLKESIDKNFKYPQDYSDKQLNNMQQFEEVAVNLMDIFSYIIQKGINEKMPNVINDCIKSINDITFKLHLKKVGIYTQSFFYLNSASTIFDYSFQAYKKDVFIEGHDAKELLPLLFEELIKQKHPAVRTILQKYCYFLLDLQKLDKLDRWFLGGLTVGNFITLRGRLGEIAHKCVVNYNIGIEVRNCLDDCIETFNIIKEKFEDSPPENIGLYNVLKWQFEQLYESVEHYKINDTNLFSKLKNYIASFKDLK